ncbi:MAG: hypothetical protein Q7S01_01780 [bacterium]|nr:hypothetical protein [bacterium]
MIYRDKEDDDAILPGEAVDGLLEETDDDEVEKEVPEEEEEKWE